MIREYELGLVIDPSLTDEQLENQIVRIGQSIEGQGGQIVKLDRWGRRRLAYPISRHREGYYAFINMRMDSRAVREVEGFLAVQESIMRHLMAYIDPRMQAERKRREQAEAARIAAQAAHAEAERAAFAAAVEQRLPATETVPADLEDDGMPAAERDERDAGAEPEVETEAEAGEAPEAEAEEAE